MSVLYINFCNKKLFVKFVELYYILKMYAYLKIVNKLNIVVDKFNLDSFEIYAF
jgi:hypothetical protein